MSIPTLSIIVPSFNQGRFLGEALDSIFSQSQKALEVIVIDGASRDDTVERLRAYATRHPELRWVSEPDNGPADAVNKGLTMISGELVGICSADDRYCAGAFSKLSGCAIQNPDCGFFYGDVAAIDEAGSVLYRGHLPSFSWKAFFAISLAIPQGSIFFRTSLARKVGGWNGSYYSCDLDYWLRMLFQTKAIKIDDVLSHWRIHEEQRTRHDRIDRLRRDYERMIRESVEIRAAPSAIRRWARASYRLWSFHQLETRPWSARLDVLVALLLFPSYPLYLPRGQLLRVIPGHAALRNAWRMIRRPFAR